VTSASAKDRLPKFSNIEVNGEGQPSPTHQVYIERRPMFTP
jgi:hypothetical protein